MAHLEKTSNFLYEMVETEGRWPYNLPREMASRIEITVETTPILTGQIVSVFLKYQCLDLITGHYEIVQPEELIVLTCKNQSEELIPVDGIAQTQFQSDEPGTYNLQACCGDTYGEAEVVIE